MNSDPLAPGLLLAAPPLGDPNFAKSVVLLAAHGPQGSLGWVVNGQEIASVSQLLRDAGLTPAELALPSTSAYETKVLAGGPVSPRSAWLLYERDARWNHESQIVLSNHWAGTADRTMVEAVAQGNGPSNFRLILGYAGWAPGQLDEEIRAGAWMPAPFDEALVFQGEMERLWELAYQELIGVSPFAFTSLRSGSA